MGVSLSRGAQSVSLGFSGLLASLGPHQVIGRAFKGMPMQPSGPWTMGRQGWHSPPPHGLGKFDFPPNAVPPGQMTNGHDCYTYLGNQLQGGGAKFAILVEGVNCYMCTYHKLGAGFGILDYG